MQKVYRVTRLNEEGSESGVIAYVSDGELADRLALDQGSYSNGKVTPVDVYGSFSELPEGLRIQVNTAESRRDDKVAMAVKEFMDSLSDVPEDKREAVLEELKKKLSS